MVRRPGSRLDRWTRPRVREALVALWSAFVLLRWAVRLRDHGVRDGWDAAASVVLGLFAVLAAVSAARWALGRVRSRRGRRAVGHLSDRG
ncbi:hypothetical protein [Streptomyces sp. NPDC001380]|uniref:hypothetical protein n=1 Tax=Streptomyces sp. NPDC001380 TaxID=3364566 RepID=UPI0036CC2F43